MTEALKLASSKSTPGSQEERSFSSHRQSLSSLSKSKPVTELVVFQVVTRSSSLDGIKDHTELER